MLECCATYRTEKFPLTKACIRISPPKLVSANTSIAARDREPGQRRLAGGARHRRRERLHQGHDEREHRGKMPKLDRVPPGKNQSCGK